MGSDLSAPQHSTDRPGPTRVRDFLRLLGQALIQDRRLMMVLALALIFLAVSQSALLFLFKGFLVVLFETGDSDQLPLASLFPDGVAPWFALEGKWISRELATTFVPGIILLAGLTKALATYFYQSRQQVLVLSAARFLRIKIFNGILSHSFLAVSQKSPAQWMSIIMNDVLLLQIRFAGCLTSFVKDSVLIVSCFAVLLVLHWPSALILTMLAPFVMFGMGWGARRIAFFAERWQIELANLSGKILDIRKRFDFMRSQGGELVERAYFDQINEGYYQMIRRSLLLRSAFAPAMEFVGISLFCVFVVLIQKGYLGSGLEGEVLLQFFLALGLILKPMRNFGEQLTKLSETKGFLAQALAALPQTDVAEAKPVPSADAVKLPAQVSKVQVAYGDQVAAAADNLTLPPAGTIAVVGPSGSGKTTLIKALAGLIEPANWESNYDWATFAAASVLVPQQPFLFSDSLAANLTYGTREIPSDAEIQEALATVNMSTINGVALDLKTPFAALNQSLSGGQVQRLVMARAILQSKSILLFDEATSALDAENERQILSEVISYVQQTGRALVAVTHRMKCLPLFDQVWFVHQGKLAAVGSHVDLLENAEYRQFCQLEEGAS